MSGWIRDERLDRLTAVIETLAASVVAHDDQIEANNKQIGALIDFTSKNTFDMADLKRLQEEIGLQFQAYLHTIHLKQ